MGLLANCREGDARAALSALERAFQLALDEYVPPGERAMDAYTKSESDDDDVPVSMHQSDAIVIR